MFSYSTKLINNKKQTKGETREVCKSWNRPGTHKVGRKRRVPGDANSLHASANSSERVKALIYAIFSELDLPFPAVATQFSARPIFLAPWCRSCCDGVVSSSFGVSFAVPSCQRRCRSSQPSDGRRRADVHCLTFYDSLMAR